MSQTERLYWIDAQIRSGRFPNADVVTHQFGVSRRTAFTDRDHLLNHLDAPLVFDHSRKGWTYTNPSYVLPFLALSPAEANALRRALLAAQEYLPPVEAAPVRLLADRLQPYLPNVTLPAPESLSGAVHPAVGAGVPATLLENCRKAIEEKRSLDLLYYSAHRNATHERRVRPYHLNYWRGEPYLIAWCEWRQGFRAFFLGRVREWKVAGAETAFARDPSSDADAYIAQGFEVRHGEPAETVRVCFTPYQARWVRERRYHESQEVEEKPDGSLILTLRVAGTTEVGRWVRGYGPEAEVLEPATLRAELAEDAKKLQKIYGVSSE